MRKFVKAKSIWWTVSLTLANGQLVVVRVAALRASDAEYRGAIKAEGLYGSNVQRVVRCMRDA
jgi:hypothetical protein